VRNLTVLLLLGILLQSAPLARADVFSASDYQVLDPVINFPGDRMTSNDFILLGTISQISIGTSTAADYEVKSGFLYYPFVTIPTVTPTAGDASVELSWSAASGFLGWTVSGYNVGYASVSGGPYTYVDSGNDTDETVSGLTNDTAYYFIVRPEDFFGNSIATSSEVSATPAAVTAPPPSAPPSDPGGGGSLAPPRIFPPQIPPCAGRSDFNCDGRVDLKDLSIFLFLESQPPEANPADLVRDETINPKDLSVLFFEWSAPLFSFVPGEYVNGIPALFPEPADGLALITQSEPGAASEKHLEEPEEPLAPMHGISILEKIIRVIMGIIGAIINFFASLF